MPLFQFDCDMFHIERRIEKYLPIGIYTYLGSIAHFLEDNEIPDNFKRDPYLVNIIYNESIIFTKKIKIMLDSSSQDFTEEELNSINTALEFINSYIKKVNELHLSVYDMDLPNRMPIYDVKPIAYFVPTDITCNIELMKAFIKNTSESINADMISNLYDKCKGLIDYIEHFKDVTPKNLFPSKELLCIHEISNLCKQFMIKVNMLEKESKFVKADLVVSDLNDDKSLDLNNNKTLDNNKSLDNSDKNNKKEYVILYRDTINKTNNFIVIPSLYQTKEEINKFIIDNKSIIGKVYRVCEINNLEMVSLLCTDI